jgi:ferredoxin-type protein NapG
MTEKNSGEQGMLGMSRRTFCIGAVGAAAAIGLGTLKPLSAEALVRPPGGQDEDALLAGCIRCEKCVEACPEKVIAMAHVEDGFINVRTPVMNFKDGYCTWCDYDAGGSPRCVDVCPTAALCLPDGATPENTILGVAKINTDWCLAYRLKGCRICVDACPYEAIYQDENLMPHVKEDVCNGCGACYEACISLEDSSALSGMTDRAIAVKPIER